MRTHFLTRTVHVGLLATAACGGAVSPGTQPSDAGPSSHTEAGFQDGAGTSDGAWGTSPDGGAWSTVCPATAPAPGSACELNNDNTWCEYGTSWWAIGCNTVLECVNEQWMDAPTSPCFPQPGPNASSCPSDPLSIQPDTPCAEANLACYYGEGPYCVCRSRAGCQGGDAATGGVWLCGPSGGCPTVRPRLGSSCSVSSTYCYYNDASGIELVCSGGTWQVTTSGGC